MKNGKNHKIKHKVLLKNLILIVVLAVTVFAVSWAWFINSEKGKISGMQVSLYAGQNLEISLDQNEYKHSLDLKKDSTILDDLDLLDLTGDGKTFHRPYLEQSGNQAEVKPDKEWTAGVVNKEYISFDLYFRSDSPVDVYLGKESVVLPSVGMENLIWKQGETQVYAKNPSSYGPFSRDCIIGATRLSVLSEAGDAGDVRFIWLPHPQIYLDARGADWKVLDNVIDQSLNTYHHQYYNENKVFVPNLDNTNPNMVTALLADKNNKPEYDTTKIAALSGTPDADGYYYSSVKINIWIEGCDAEARRALLDGIFEVDLDFVSYLII